MITRQLRVLLPLIATLGAPPTSWASCASAPAAVRFSGTAFAETPFRVQGRQVTFFADTDRAISYYFNEAQHTWCFTAEKTHREGCLNQVVDHGRLAIEVGNHRYTKWVLRDNHKSTIANLRLSKRTLAIEFVNDRGVVTGKRMILKAQPDRLEVEGWNCPNTHYLSCAGAQLESHSVVDEAEGAPAREEVAELSQNLGRYRASCRGWREVATQLRSPSSQESDTETKKAPLPEPFTKPF